MTIIFLFMTKLKREQEKARMKNLIEVKKEIKKEVCAFPPGDSNANWSVEEFVDGSYKMETFIYQI